MPTTHPRNVNAVYESLAALANRRDGPTPITDEEYYPAVAELMCWKDEIELAERIAHAHPLNPAGSYGRLVARVARHHHSYVPSRQVHALIFAERETTAAKVAFDAMMDVIEYGEA